MNALSRRTAILLFSLTLVGPTVVAFAKPEPSVLEGRSSPKETGTQVPVSSKPLGKNATLQEQIQGGDEHLRAGQYLAAGKIYQKALQVLDDLSTTDSCTDAMDHLHIAIERIARQTFCGQKVRQDRTQLLVKIGHAAFLGGDRSQAVASYERALQGAKGAEKELAAYALASVYLLRNKTEDLEKAQRHIAQLHTEPYRQEGAYLRHVLQGFSKPDAPKPLANTDLLVQIQQAEKFLAQKDYRRALEIYKKLMLKDPTNTRFHAGMAWALIRLQRPMRHRVWSVAMREPTSLQQLAKRLKSLGNQADARALRKRLATGKAD